ncbi:Uncharacterized protein Rs2_45183 [Raphanus sativus]|nr:Uncharacterized protein Rs2_45183 [Raphanus sativus]
MRWRRLQKTSIADCRDIVVFRGKFYAIFINEDVFAIDPYTLETTPLTPPEIVDCGRCNYLVPYGDDEGFYLVERIIVRNGVLCFSKLACRVSVLDEEAGEWVVVSDLGDRVLLIGRPGNCSGNASCSAKELPDGCDVSGSSMLFINEIFNIKEKKQKSNIVCMNTSAHHVEISGQLQKAIQRRQEVAIIEKRISAYYRDLKKIKSKFKKTNRKPKFEIQFQCNKSKFDVYET